MRQSDYLVYFSYPNVGSDLRMCMEGLVCELVERGIDVCANGGGALTQDEERKVQVSMRQATTYVLVITPSYLTSSWGSFEMAAVATRARFTSAVEVVVVLAEGSERSALPPPLRASRLFDTSLSTVDVVKFQLFHLLCDSPLSPERTDAKDEYNGHATSELAVVNGEMTPRARLVSRNLHSSSDKAVAEVELEYQGTVYIGSAESAVGVSPALAASACLDAMKKVCAASAGLELQECRDVDGTIIVRVGFREHESRLTRSLIGAAALGGDNEYAGVKAVLHALNRRFGLLCNDQHLTRRCTRRGLQTRE